PEPPPAGPFGLDPGPDPDQELPADPFPDWHLITAAHPWPEPDTDEYGCPEPLDDPYPGYFLSQGACPPSCMPQRGVLIGGGCPAG
ncbi:hypothetical protein, partial [Arthrobacter sp. PsM3]|uniref:hypothetical protein n=1 Tax=Arthrobacter sp. PsM3 TaxID=3030531 RepID=UPI00263BD9B5